MNFIIRIIFFVSTLVLFVLSTFIGSLFIFNEEKKLRFRTRQTARASRAILRLLNISVDIEGEEYLRSHEGGGLFISNHLSFVDIPVLSSIRDFVFVTSQEMKESAFEGTVSGLGGSIFVERRNPIKLRKEIRLIRTLIEDGFRVLFFPEGTSSDGRQVLPFKSAFFTTILKNSAPLLSICINYTHANGEPFTDKYRDEVFFYGDHSFIGQILQTLKLKSLNVSVKIFPPILAASAETRHQLAQKSHHLVSSFYTPI